MATQDLSPKIAENAESKSFRYSFKSSKSQEEIFELLLEVDQWWSGIFQETITGKSHRLNDEFLFNAGGGMHYSKQKLLDLELNKKIVWLVTESNLSFLKDTNEWDNTKIRFDISISGGSSRVTFTHEGLAPQLECYESCTGAWTQYMGELEAKLK